MLMLGYLMFIWGKLMLMLGKPNVNVGKNLILMLGKPNVNVRIPYVNLGKTNVNVGKTDC